MNKLKNDMCNIVYETVENIVKDNEERVKLYKDFPKVLEKGIFYENDYCQYIKEVNEERYNKFKEGGFLFHGFAPQDYFSMKQDKNSPTGFLIQNYNIKKGVQPSEALAAIQKGLSFLGCGGTIQIGELEALKTTLGTEKFDTIFAYGSKTPLCIGEGLRSFNIKALYKSSLIDDPKNEKFVKGQRVFINGPYVLGQEILNGPVKKINLYNLKHSNGYGTSFNVICKKGGNQPTFFGLGLSSEGFTYEEVCDNLIKEYNKTPINDLDLMTEKHLKKLQSSISETRQKLFNERKDHQITIEEFKESNGGEIVVSEFNFKRIKKLQDADNENAAKLFASWDKELN